MAIFQQLPTGRLILSYHVAAAAKFAVEMLLVLPLFFLWFILVSFLVRPFGIQLPLGPLTSKSRAAFQALTFPQYFWVCGILYCGGGLFIMTIFSRYLEWKYWHGAPLTIETLYRDIVQNALLGAMFGVVGGLTRSGNNT